MQRLRPRPRRRRRAVPPPATASRWFIPRPSRPTAPACSAVRRVSTGCCIAVAFVCFTAGTLIESWTSSCGGSIKGGNFYPANFSVLAMRCKKELFTATGAARFLPQNVASTDSKLAVTGTGSAVHYRVYDDPVRSVPTLRRGWRWECELSWWWECELSCWRSQSGERNGGLDGGHTSFALPRPAFGVCVWRPLRFSWLGGLLWASLE